MSEIHWMESFGGFDDFLIYLGISATLMIAFVAIYIKITPYHEIALIRAGNMAAAYSLSGTIIGMAIPLSNAIKFSANLIDMAIWAVIALVIQLLVFVIARVALPHISEDIPADKHSAGFFLGAISVAAGMLNAACMSY